MGTRRHGCWLEGAGNGPGRVPNLVIQHNTPSLSLTFGLPWKEREMKKTHELTRRQMLAGIAVSTVGAAVKGSVTNQPKSTHHFLSNTKSRIIRVGANPEPIAIDTAKTAVIVVDMQNDFGSKGGMFDRAGIDISGIQKVVDPTARVLASARSAGVKIIYLKMGFRPDLSDPSDLLTLQTGYATCSLVSERMCAHLTARKVEFLSATHGIQRLSPNSSRRPTILSSINIDLAASTELIWTLSSHN